MAQLHKTDYKLPPMEFNREGRWEDTAHHKAFEELRSKHEMVSFGVGDGFAWYIVKSRKPLVLQHVDYCDGYMVSGAMIRGLRVADIDAYSTRSKLGFRF